jgi:hypothetical protein
VEISIRISKATHNPPDGYLFVWSPEPFEAGPTLIHWSADAAYWSLDPSGSNKLSHEESSRLGFPSIELRINVYALSWDETVYAGLRKFDECKGFDPESQDVARELGYPLFKVDVLGSAGGWMNKSPADSVVLILCVSDAGCCQRKVWWA